MLASKKYLLAAAKFREIVSLDPNNVLAWGGLAESLARLRKYDEAFDTAKRALEINPKMAMAHVVAGIVFARQNKLQEAENELRRALEINPSSEYGLVSMGAVLLQKGLPRDAEIVLEKAININPKSGLAYYNLSLCDSSQKRFDRATKNAWLAFRLGMTLQTAVMLLLVFQARFSILIFVGIGILLITAYAVGSALGLVILIPVVGFFVMYGILQFSSNNRSRSFGFFITAALIVLAYFVNHR